jgi:hypothetical protein
MSSLDIGILFGDMAIMIIFAVAAYPISQKTKQPASINRKGCLRHGSTHVIRDNHVLPGDAEEAV